MSTHTNSQRITIPRITSLKGKGRIVSLTAYTAPMAALMDEFVDLIIVGDSTGMVAYGMDSTLTVTLDMMIRHGQAVVKGSSRACVIIDMPFASYQESPQQAFRNAAKVMAETGAQGVKLEGGNEMLETVDFLTSRGIPVMPHIGLMPQHVNAMGGYKFQARTAEDIEQLVALASAFERRNAFSLLIEGTSEAAARNVTEAVRIPTIGIGASPACDGQVLVTEDALGLFSDYTPRFVKRYIDLSALIRDAFARYEHEVRTGAFPALEHCFGVDKNPPDGTDG
ncbi:3-methyl-2-oxobutanoate hydroxymethyltransferase [Methylomonas sp. MgM2]